MGRLRGYGPGFMSIPVYSFVPQPKMVTAGRLGCACKKLGDDDGLTTDYFSGDPGPGPYVGPYPGSSAPAGGTAAVPSGFGYGPSPDGGVAVYPTNGGVPPSTYASAIPASVYDTNGVVPPSTYASAIPAWARIDPANYVGAIFNPASSPLSSGMLSSASSLIPGLSNTMLAILGGVLLVVAVHSGSRR
jgi:hypothetical protein